MPKKTFINKQNKSRISSNKMLQNIINSAIIMASAYIIFFIMSSMMNSVEANTSKIQDCFKYVDSRWKYQMTLKDTKAFDKMPFFCRKFGWKCDSNHSSLNEMQKEAMKIYIDEGKTGNYMDVIYKYSEKYFNNFFKNWFCIEDLYMSRFSFSYRNLPFCPSSLRSSESRIYSLLCLQDTKELRGCLCKD